MKDIYIQEYINKLEELMYKYKEANETEKDLLAVKLSQTLFSFINTGHQLPIKAQGIVSFGDKIINELFTSKGLETFIKV